MQLLKDISKCLRNARKLGAARFSVLGLSGTASVRCNVHARPTGAEARMEYLLTLSWLDGTRPTEVDAHALVSLFLSQLDHDMVSELLREEQNGTPKRWHRTYKLAPSTEASS